MRQALVSGLPFGALSVTDDKRVTIGEAAGDWSAVAWPAQLAAGALLGLMQQSLDLAATIASEGMAGALRQRHPESEGCILTSWAWCATFEGFPAATVAWGNRELSAAAILAGHR